MASKNFFGDTSNQKIKTETEKRKEYSIWVEKYRPMDLTSFVGNKHIKDKATGYIEENDIPHLLFHGRAGSGKTTLANILSKTINCDRMYINASDENSIDDIRTKVKNFASSASFNDFKIIVLDEADFLTPQALAALRNLMETYSATTRFILTCNYPEKIIEPIISRCQVFEMIPPSKGDVAVLLVVIFSKENIKFEKEDLKFLINSYFPDIRRIINTAQGYSKKGEFKLNEKEMIDSDFKLKIVDIISDSSIPTPKSFTMIRKILADNSVSDFSDVYRLLYNSLDAYTANRNQKAQIILILAEMQYKAAFSVDKEINFMSCVIQILNEVK